MGRTSVCPLTHSRSLLYCNRHKHCSCMYLYRRVYVRIFPQITVNWAAQISLNGPERDVCWTLIPIRRQEVRKKNKNFNKTDRPCSKIKNSSEFFYGNTRKNYAERQSCRCSEIKSHKTQEKPVFSYIEENILLSLEVLR